MKRTLLRNSLITFTLAGGLLVAATISQETVHAIGSGSRVDYYEYEGPQIIFSVKSTNALNRAEKRSGEIVSIDKSGALNAYKGLNSLGEINLNPGDYITDATLRKRAERILVEGGSDADDIIDVYYVSKTNHDMKRQERTINVTMYDNGKNTKAIKSFPITADKLVSMESIAKSLYMQCKGNFKIRQANTFV